MTEQEKQLLLADICGRLPYDVEAQVVNTIEGESKPLTISKELTFSDVESFANNGVVCNIKPYLRPMSSMTDEEKKEMSDGSSLAFEPALNSISGYCPETMAYNTFNVDFCLAHHLDYRGLISKGLAIKAPEAMYKAMED